VFDIQYQHLFDTIIICLYVLSNTAGYARILQTSMVCIAEISSNSRHRSVDHFNGTIVLFGSYRICCDVT
jgi:hypothetical protein